MTSLLNRKISIFSIVHFLRFRAVAWVMDQPLRTSSSWVILVITGPQASLLWPISYSHLTNQNLLPLRLHLTQQWVRETGTAAAGGNDPVSDNNKGPPPVRPPQKQCFFSFFRGIVRKRSDEQPLPSLRPPQEKEENSFRGGDESQSGQFSGWT